MKNGIYILLTVLCGWVAIANCQNHPQDYAAYLLLADTVVGVGTPTTPRLRYEPEKRYCPTLKADFSTPSTAILGYSAAAPAVNMPANIAIPMLPPKQRFRSRSLLEIPVIMAAGLLSPGSDWGGVLDRASYKRMYPDFNGPPPLGW